MGLYDRDYYRSTNRTGGMGAVRLWSITTWLIAINIAVFIIDAFLRRVTEDRLIQQGLEPLGVNGPLFDWGFFSIKAALLQGQVWRFISFQFLHAGPWHILVNMFGLWMFGPVVELSLGSRRFTLFYFLCGVAGAATYCALWGLGILTPSRFLPMTDTPMVGASAGIFGVLLAAAYLAPDRPIFIYFAEIPLKVFAWVMMGIAAYAVLIRDAHAGGQAAHLGGGLLGYLLIRHESLLDVVAPKRRVRGRKVKDWSRDMNR